jgi:predicted AAA+ superfamily ATPase
MTARVRIYDRVLQDHFARHPQMPWVSGPRQVGKTTTCRMEGTDYLNWDNADDRRVILRGPSAVVERLRLEQLREIRPIVVFDELHKDKKWKAFLKGFFDVYGERTRVIVTGSSRLDVYRRGSDSLMGRYFLYRMHPFSVAEIIRVDLPTSVIQPPSPVSDTDWQALWEHGGFPEPFLRRDMRFTRRWRSLRNDQLTHEDIRDVALRKEPKWFLRDWSGIENPRPRAETLVACHLLKAVEGRPRPKSSMRFRRYSNCPKYKPTASGKPGVRSCRCEPCSASCSEPRRIEQTHCPKSTLAEE